MQDDDDLEHEAVSQLIIERFVKYRLPPLMKMKDEVHAGKVLSDGELELLRRILQRAHQFRKLVHEFPEYQDLVARIIDLFHEITELALRNEKENGKS
jgi:hypothetical protein